MYWIEEVMSKLRPERILIGGDFNIQTDQLEKLGEGNFISKLLRVDIGDDVHTSMNYSLTGSYTIDHLLYSEETMGVSDIKVQGKVMNPYERC